MTATAGSSAVAHDVVVVGAGAAGCWAAKVLCERGLEVLLLDAGPALDRSGGRDPGTGHPLVTRLGALLAGQSVQLRCPAYDATSRSLFVNDRDNPYTTPARQPFNWFRGRQVGGRLHLWARLVPRLSELELEAAGSDGHGPPWPLSYRELAPHYERLERFLGVRGETDGLATMPDGIFTGRRQLTAAEGRFRETIRARWPARPVVSARVAEPDSGPLPASLLDARSSGRLSLRPDAVATVIETDSGGRAAGVRFIDRESRREELAPAKAVVLAASAIETVRLMLNSGSGAHPDGLGNGSGLLGRGLMDHVLTGVGGPLADSGSDAAEAGSDRGAVTGFQIPRFQNLGSDRAPFLRGYGLQGGIGRGAGWYMLAHGEMLSRPENGVRLDPARRDAWGVPLAQISCSHSNNERAMSADQCRTLLETAAAAGLRTRRPPSGGALGSIAFRLWRRKLLTGTGAFLPGSAAHEIGGAPMGADPAASVANRFGRCWDADNVFVADGAVFPSGCWQNVTLTIMALADRACEHLADEHEAGRL